MPFRVFSGQLKIKITDKVLVTKCKMPARRKIQKPNTKRKLNYALVLDLLGLSDIKNFILNIKKELTKSILYLYNISYV
jgi:hypothetical protein